MLEYVNVKVPVELRKRFEDLNKQYELGYASFAEVVKEALRKRLEELMSTYSSREAA